MHVLILWMTLIASAVAGDGDVLKVDADSYPEVRVYLQASSAAASSGRASVTFDEVLDPDYEPALVWADERAAGGNTELPSVSLPSTSIEDLPVLGFNQQSDPVEGRLVVFLVDASASMRGIGLAEVRSLAASVIKTLKPNDKVAILRFAKETKEVLAPTPLSNSAAVRAAVEGLEVDAGGTTRINDAMADAVQGLVRDLPEPELDGRRFFFLFSDGADKGSSTKIEDAFLKLDDPPSVFTVGVGSGSGSQLGDLLRIATIAGDKKNFFDHPEPEELVAAFKESSKPLEQQLLVEFEAPAWFHRTGRHELTLTLSDGSGDPRNLPVTLDVATVPQDLLDARTTLAEDLGTVKVAWLAHEGFMDKLTWGGGGFGVLLLVGFVAYQNRQRAIERERQEADEAEDRARRRSQEQAALIEQQLAEQSRQQREMEGRLAARQEEAARQAALDHQQVFGELLGVDGPLKGARFGLLSARARVGRGDCDVVFPSDGQADMSISRMHAEFAMQGGGWMLTSLSNGNVNVAGRVLRQGDSYPIKFGDQVSFGNSTFLFRPPP